MNKNIHWSYKKPILVFNISGFWAHVYVDWIFMAQKKPIVGFGNLWLDEYTMNMINYAWELRSRKENISLNWKDMPRAKCFFFFFLRKPRAKCSCQLVISMIYYRIHLSYTTSECEWKINRINTYYRRVKLAYCPQFTC